MAEVFKTAISKKKVARTLFKSLSIQFPGYKISGVSKETFTPGFSRNRT